MATPQGIEREGFVKMTLVALAANMAAAYIHSGKLVDWDKIIHSANEGANKCWKTILEDRDANKSTD